MSYTKNTQDSVHNAIFITKNYGQFKTSPIQRALSKTIMATIHESMDVKILDIPIIVNENLEIIDGHHTFMVRKNLKLPIPYYILEGAGSLEIRLLNLSRKNWSLMNVLNSFKNSKNKHIQTLINIILDNSIPSQIIPLYLYKGQYTGIRSKTILADLQKENTSVLDTIEELQKNIKTYNKYKKFTKQVNFYYMLKKYPELDCEEMELVVNKKFYLDSIKEARGLDAMEKVLFGLVKKSAKS